MNQEQYLKTGRHLGALYFDNTPAGRFSREYMDTHAPYARTPAERDSDAIKARHRRRFKW